MFRRRSTMAAADMLLVIVVALGSMLTTEALPGGDSYFDDGSMSASDMDAAGAELYKGGSLRDLEHLQHSSLWGHKTMGGGAGEGQQYLSPSGALPNKEEVKTDAVLPAYCDPPNPCPPGFSGDDGCLEDFDNTAEFSREYQSRQDCLCDEDHMFTCPPNHRKASESLRDEVEEFSQALNVILDKAGIKDQHKTLVAKKFHAKKRQVNKRAAGFNNKAEWFNNNHQNQQQNQKQHHNHGDNPYLLGERLRTVAKKG